MKIITSYFTDKYCSLIKQELENNKYSNIYKQEIYKGKIIAHQNLYNTHFPALAYYKLCIWVARNIFE